MWEDEEEENKQNQNRHKNKTKMSSLDEVLGGDSGMPSRDEAAAAAASTDTMSASQRRTLEAKARELESLASANRKEAKAIRARLAHHQETKKISTRSNLSRTVHLQKAVDDLKLRYAGLTNNMIRVPTPNKPEWVKPPKHLTETEKRRAREHHYAQLLLWLAREQEDLLASIRIAEEGLF